MSTNMSGDDSMLWIKNYDLWCQLSDEEYKELKVQHHVIEVPKGEYIYFEAYNHNKIYFVKEGTIKIGFIDPDGNEKIKEIIQKGEVFGQFSLERNSLHGEFAQAYKHDVSICATDADVVFIGLGKLSVKTVPLQAELSENLPFLDDLLDLFVAVRVDKPDLDRPLLYKIDFIMIISLKIDVFPLGYLDNMVLY